ncbi:MAG TPA: ribbon-helix-helix domain-containing protein [archaeon]|nr:ribbon-helix-helix domain-containing protein [archaeon]
MKKHKQEIITFKVDEPLLRKLQDLPNRSEFIRRAVLEALENVCPLCQGTGSLSPKQKEHWSRFSSDHYLEKCELCHEVHLVCENKGPDNPHE